MVGEQRVEVDFDIEIDKAVGVAFDIGVEIERRRDGDVVPQLDAVDPGVVLDRKSVV